jgi:hypothetical protein
VVRVSERHNLHGNKSSFRITVSGNNRRLCAMSGAIRFVVPVTIRNTWGRGVPPAVTYGATCVHVPVLSVRHRTSSRTRDGPDKWVAWRPGAGRRFHSAYHNYAGDKVTLSRVSNAGINDLQIWNWTLSNVLHYNIMTCSLNLTLSNVLQYNIMTCSLNSIFYSLHFLEPLMRWGGVDRMLLWCAWPDTI